MASWKKGALAGTVVVGGGVAVLLLVCALFPKVQFLLGGGLVSAGTRMQDRLTAYDFVHEQDLEPEHIWTELSKQNELASEVRATVERTARHPVVALVACMDGRIDTSELVGDTRGYYYVVRTAGSVLSQAEQEMLELAVENGVKLVLLTSHTDCAAEAAAADPETHAKFPALTSLVDEREERIAEFLERPVIRERIAAGELLVKRARIDTATDRLLPEVEIPLGSRVALD
jgi:carbonic anhydrase